MVHDLAQVVQVLWRENLVSRERLGTNCCGTAFFVRVLKLLIVAAVHLYLLGVLYNLRWQKNTAAMVIGWARIVYA